MANVKGVARRYDAATNAWIDITQQGPVGPMGPVDPTLAARLDVVERDILQLGGTIHKGTGGPPTATGVAGDYWHSTDLKRLYGPKVSDTAWGSFTTPKFRAATGTYSSGGATSVALPAGTVAGDLAILHLRSNATSPGTVDSAQGFVDTGLAGQPWSWTKVITDADVTRGSFSTTSISGGYHSYWSLVTYGDHDGIAVSGQASFSGSGGTGPQLSGGGPAVVVFSYAGYGAVDPTTTGVTYTQRVRYEADLIALTVNDAPVDGSTVPLPSWAGTTNPAGVHGFLVRATLVASFVDLDLPGVQARVAELEKVPRFSYQGYLGGPTDLGQSYTSRIKGLSPAAYWQLAETSGTSFVDSSGNARNGTWSAAPTWAVARLVNNTSDTAATFAGQTASIAGLPSETATGFSAEAWINTTAGGTIFYRDNDANLSNPGRHYRLLVNNGKVEAYVFTNGSFAHLVGTTVVNDGVTRHVVVTHDKSVARLYVNGVQEVSANVGPALEDNSVALRIGGFTGTLDDLAIYQYPLTPTQVKENNDQGRLAPGVLTAGLLVQGDVVRDRDRLWQAKVNAPTAATPVEGPEWRLVLDGQAAPLPPFSLPGTLTVQTGQSRYYAPTAGGVASIRASVGVAPAGADVIVDVRRNGTVIARVTIAAGTNTATTSIGATPSSVNYAANDYFTVDIAQVGSTTSGSHLTVQMIGA